MRARSYHMFFFFNDTATTEIYTLSLHDALPICIAGVDSMSSVSAQGLTQITLQFSLARDIDARSEEHTSELQSLAYLVCRLLLEKKKKSTPICITYSISIYSACSRNLSTGVVLS